MTPEEYEIAFKKYWEARFYWANAGDLTCGGCGSSNMSGCDGQYDCQDCGGQTDLEMPEPPDKPE